MTNGNKSKARILKASRLLQSKVGSGAIDPAIIQKSQDSLDKVNVDFAPMAQQYLDALGKTIEAAKEGSGEPEELIDAMVEPIMQIKANASMFNYQLIGNLANIVMNFLENINEIDKQVIQIVEANQATLNLIVSNKMSGDGGDQGKQLEKELQEACSRYFSKKS